MDILLEIDTGEDIHAVSELIKETGFTEMSESEKRISFNYGYTPEGYADAVFHLHLCFAGDNSELYFRDYLNDHPDVAKMYEKLKLDLWHNYEHNRDAYTAAKTEFVENFSALARVKHINRY